ncbi:sensor histidine kinase [bacterium]|nr:sensor histidine kinase [bacterium]
MTSLKLSRIILVCVFFFVSLLAGYVLFQYYDHLCKAKRLHFFEYNQSILEKLSTRTQQTWHQNILDLISYSQRIMDNSSSHISKALKVVVESQDSIHQAFYIDEKMIYLPQWKKFRISRLQESQIFDFLENPDFKKAEIFEYQYENYTEAIKLYEHFWLENPDNFSAANGLARCLYKTKSYTRSEKIYRQIFTQNPTIKSQNKTPLAIIAGFQLLNIYQAQTNTVAAFAFGQHLYNDLLDEKWGFPQHKTDFFKQKALASLSPFFREGKPPRSFRRILAREKQLNQVKSDVRFISNRVIPFIEGSIIENYKIYFLSSQKHPTHFLLIIPHQHNHIVLDIDYAAYVKKNLITPLKVLAKDHAVGMRLHFNQTQTVLAEIPRGTSAGYPISARFPDLRLEIVLPVLPQIRLEDYLMKLKLYFGAGFSLFIAVLLLIYFVLDKQIQLADLKSDFVSHVSHELKTPLTSLRMFSELLQKNPRLPVKKRNQYYEIMNQESVRLSRLIENLLDISRIERKKNQYTFHPEKLDTILKFAVEVFHYASDDFSQQLKTDFKCGHTLFLDKDAVIQLVLNILDNSRKFSPKQSTIWLRSRLLEHHALIEIEDQGLGMSKKEIRKIFRMFYQIKKSYENKFKGVGLGLAIVKNIAQAHKADVHIESVKDKGTIIRVCFPLEPERKPEAVRLKKSKNPDFSKE